MENDFKTVEEAFQKLRDEWRAGTITRREFLERMKEFQVKDEEGRVWMIGAQSGKWYYLKGSEWIQSEPPPPETKTPTPAPRREPKERRNPCPYCAFENRVQASVCARCGGTLQDSADVCPNCGSKLLPPLFECYECSRRVTPFSVEKPKVKTARVAAAVPVALRLTRYNVRSIHPPSFFLFGGALGILCGIILGAFAGASGKILFVSRFVPAFFQELQGKLTGAILFGAAGGLAGFIFLGGAFILMALLVNLLLSFIGGIRLNIEETKEMEEVRERAVTVGKEGEEESAEGMLIL